MAVGAHDPGGVEGPGTELGNYTILEVIGEGGFGSVYRAQQNQPVRRLVALKILKLGMDTRQIVARFGAERQALALMDHPSIAKVYDAGATATGRPYFVMELVDGRPLNEYCDDASLPTAARLELFVQVCLAVQHAHHKGILHRDLKPSNVLVTEVDGAPLPKVIDFGIAKAMQKSLTEASLATTEHQIIGTPEYMAPEQASGIDVDTRADVYALGVMLYELLTGTRPFEIGGNSPHAVSDLTEILRHIREVTPPKPSTRVSGLGAEAERVAGRRGTLAAGVARALRGDLDWIVLKALEKDRERRYATVRELADDIERHLANEPVLASPPSRAYRLRKFVRRNRLLVGAASSMVGALLCALGVLIGGYLAVSAERDLATAAQQRAEQAQASEASALAEAVDARELEARARARADSERLAAERAREEEVRERERAQQALAVSDAVANFLAEALAAVQPEEMGREVTMRQVLGAAARRFETHFQRSPLVEARLRQVIGESYLALGVIAEAETHLARSAQLHEQLLGPEEPRTFEARRLLARVYWRQERRDEALGLLEGLIELARASEGALGDLFDLWSSVAILHMESGRLAEAEAIWRDQIEALSGDDALDSTLLVALGNLAILYHEMARWTEALPIHQDVVAIRRQRDGPRAPITLDALNNMATACLGMGRFAEAESILVELSATRADVLGEEHPDTLGTVYNLALLYSRSGQPLKAEELLLRILDVQRRVEGAGHTSTLRTANLLGSLYRSTGHLQEAEALLRETLATSRATWGAEHPATLDPMHNLADVLSETGRTEEALALFDQLVEVRTRVEGPSSRGVTTARATAANLRIALGQTEEAARELDEVIAVLEALHGPEHNELLEAQYVLAAAEVELGHFDEAERLYEHVVDVRSRSLGEANMLTVRGLFGLSTLYRRWGRLEEKRDFVAHVVDVVRRFATGPTASPNDWAGCASYLAVCEPADLRDFTTALDLAQRAVDATQRRNPLHVLVLAEVLYFGGDHEAAVATQRELLSLLGADEPTRLEQEQVLAQMEAGTYE